MASVVSPLPADEVHDESSSRTAIECAGWSLTSRQEDTIDVLRIMLKQEHKNYPIPKGYRVAGSQQGNVLDPLTDSWRRRVCEWIFEIVDHFSFEREVVSIALNYLDRSASLTHESNGEPIARNEFQLLATCCLYLAIKLHGEGDTPEGYRLKMKISSFEELSRGLFSVKTIEATEHKICTMLDWRFHQPTAAQFLGYLVRLLPQWPLIGREQAFQDFASEVYDIAKYLTELACFDLSLAIHATSSTIAYGALLCALDEVVSRTSWSKGTQEVFLRNIAAVDHEWTPFNRAILEVKHKLRKISAETLGEEARPDQPPLQVVVDYRDNSSTLQRTNSPEEDEEDSSRGSPTCVCDPALTSTSTTRKRCRTEDPDDFRNDSSRHRQPILNTLSNDNEL